MWSACCCALGVSYVVGSCNVVAILSMADMVCLECRNCMWSGSCMSSGGAPTPLTHLCS